jgi:phosphatidylglycerol---prolipoprotein diacylglyceryl transferase
MLPTLQIGPLSLQVPGLVMIAGLWVGLLLSERAAVRRALNPSLLYNLVILSLSAGLVGARLAYVLTYPQAFIASPLSLVSLNPGLLDPLAGLVAALISALIYIQRKKLPFWLVCDTLTPCLAVLGVSFGLSHAASGSAFGAPASVPWAVYLWGAERHPSQIYETLAGGLILAGVLSAERTQRLQVPGTLFLSFIAASAAARLFLEAFRGDSYLLPSGLRLGQLIAWGLLAACLWALAKRLAMGGISAK